MTIDGDEESGGWVWPKNWQRAMIECAAKKNPVLSVHDWERASEEESALQARTCAGSWRCG